MDNNQTLPPQPNPLDSGHVQSNLNNTQPIQNQIQSNMPEQKRGKSFLLPVLVVFIFIAVLAVGYYFFTQKPASTNNTPSINKANTVVKNETPSIQPSKPVENTQAVKNCGDLNEEKLTAWLVTNDFKSLSTEDKSTLECANEAFLSCRPMEINFVRGKEQSKIKILNDEPDNCIIEGGNFGDPKRYTCKIPKKVIPEYKTDNTYPVLVAIAGASTVSSGWTDKHSVPITCTVN